MNDDPPANARLSRRRLKRIVDSQAHGNSRTTDGQKADSLSPITMDVSEEADELADLARQVGQATGDPQAEERIIASLFMGPLPPPSDLREYENIVPGLAKHIVEHSERRLEMSEAEGQFRREMRRKAYDDQAQLAYRGQIIAPLIILCDFALVLVALLKDQPGVATALGLPGLALVLVAFFAGTTMRARAGRNQADILAKSIDRLLRRAPHDDIDDSSMDA